MAESADHFSSAWSPRDGYEGANRAATYIRFRPKTPQQVIDRIIGYLKEKVRIRHQVPTLTLSLN